MLPSFNEVKGAASSAIIELEEYRRQLVRQGAKRTGYMLAIGALTIVSLVFPPLFIICCVAFVIYSIIYVSKKVKDAKLYQAEFKHRVIAPFASSMVEMCKLPNATDQYTYWTNYNPSDRVSNGWIYHSQLFMQDIHEIHGEDLFFGKLGLTDFQFSELRLVHEYETTDSKGNTSKHKMDIFKGVMFIADFHKDFDGLTILDAQTAFTRTFVGKMMRKASKVLSGAKRNIARLTIKMENEAFNRAFNIRTSDEIKARYLLSSSMLERLLSFRERHRGHVAVSFVDSFMCVAISSRKNYFEAKLKEPVDGPHLQEIYDDLKFFFELVEDFDLNTRIWSKA